MKRLSAIGASAGYWLALILLVLGLEGTALFYQYRLDEWPCVLCIHVRIWLVGLLLVALPVLGLRRQRWVVALGHAATFGIGLGLTDRSWQLLGIERGFITGGSCDMSLGLPGWLALDQWLPWLFQVQTSCGYTPELGFGITMAEALLVFSVGLALVGLVLLAATLRDRQ